MWEREKKAKLQDMDIKYQDPEVYFDGMTIPVNPR